MKKALSILLVLVMAASLMATMAFADDAVELVGNGETQGEATVTVKTVEALTFDSFYGEFVYDAAYLQFKGVTVTADASAKDVSGVTEASQVQDVTSMYAVNDDGEGTVKIAYAAADESELEAAAVAFTLTFKVLKDSDDENKPVVSAYLLFTDSASTGAGEVEVESTTTGGIDVTAKAFKLGDVNGDDVVDAKDRTFLTRHVAGWVVENFNSDAADINGDGIVDAKDRTFLTRFVAGWEVAFAIGE